MSGIYREVIYSRILLLHLAQFLLLANLTLAYVGRTSFDVSFNCLIYCFVSSYGFAIGCGGGYGYRGESEACRENARRSMVCMKVCIIYIFAAIIASINDDEVSV
jgi:hypothetical protein